MGLLTRTEKKHLKYLASLLNYGLPQLKSRSGICKSKFNHLQSFLLFNQVAIHNYSEAIYLLCKNARPHAAYVLLRSVFEAYTNAEYIKIGDSEKKLSLFAREGFIERKKVANGFDQFIKKYPQKKGSVSILEEESIDKMKEFVERRIAGVENVNRLNPEEDYPDILRRSIEIDRNITDPKFKGENELYYHLVFRYLSPYAHLNMYGLEGFIEETNKGKIFALREAGDVHSIILQTYLYYFVSLNNLFQYKILDGNMPDRYLKYYEEIRGEMVK